MSQASHDTQSQALASFFSWLSNAYDQSILRGCPPYGEMLEALVGYVYPPANQPLAILELGCGTGNVSRLLAQQFPQASLTLLDLSDKMLEETRAKVSPIHSQAQYVQAGFMTAELGEGRFDLIFSSLALHHLPDTEKPWMYRRIFSWLKPGGQFRCADQCLGLPEKTEARYLAQWKDWSTASGAPEEEIQMWLDHAAAYDHYAPLAAHLRWLDEAGFSETDCYWRKLFWTVYGGTRPA